MIVYRLNRVWHTPIYYPSLAEATGNWVRGYREYVEELEIEPAQTPEAVCNLLNQRNFIASRRAVETPNLKSDGGRNRQRNKAST